ncbi:MAG TPA: isochorismatase family protein [Edaphobacter sp.]|nr:isochorismatase family protein [Edaphobacter sp.]
MPPLQLDPAKTALVIIDLQNGIVGRPVVPHTAAEIVGRSARLAQAFREKGSPVVYVRVDLADLLHLPADECFRSPSDPLPPVTASELVPEAGFQPGDILITKRHWGAFADTGLEQTLKQRGIDTVVLTGISSNIGVESTARQGTGLGLAFVIVEDACGTTDEESHRHVFEKTFPRLARVRKTEEVLAAL